MKLTKKQKTELKILKKTEKRVKIYKRLQFIEMKDQGMTNIMIASILDVCNDTLTDWTKIFQQGGFQALCNLNYDNRRKSILDDKQEKIKQFVQNNSVDKLSKVQDWLKKEFSIKMEASWLSRYFKKNLIFLSRKHA